MRSRDNANRIELQHTKPADDGQDIHRAGRCLRKTLRTQPQSPGVAIPDSQRGAGHQAIGPQCRLSRQTASDRERAPELAHQLVQSIVQYKPTLSPMCIDSTRKKAASTAIFSISGPTKRSHAVYGMRPSASAPMTSALVGMIMLVKPSPN